MIYEGIRIGDTHTVYGCYQVCAAIRRLAFWVEEDFREFWSIAVELPTLPNALWPAPSVQGDHVTETRGIPVADCNP
ncbi:hypothetical protein B0J18DRAFT_430012 [Chaetomium sp. MPI-SDFR-AT-0129]|nr:hypothetical protein B0J18DRAFT_430012 [Chaetomium sp. MPI-SDFR-AT-0129]